MNISIEDLEQEYIPIEMKQSDVELHNPDEVDKQAQVADEVEETDNDYLLSRDRSRRFIKPH